MPGIKASCTACIHLELGKRQTDFSHQTHTMRWVYVCMECVQRVFACIDTYHKDAHVCDVCGYGGLRLTLVVFLDLPLPFILRQSLS